MELEKVPYDIIDREDEEFNQLKSKLDVDNFVNGLVIKEIDDERCQIEFVGASSSPKEYAVSKEKLRSLLMRDVIEMNRDIIVKD